MAFVHFFFHLLDNHDIISVKFYDIESGDVTTGSPLQGGNKDKVVTQVMRHCHTCTCTIHYVKMTYLQLCTYTYNVHIIAIYIGNCNSLPSNSWWKRTILQDLWMHTIIYLYTCMYYTWCICTCICIHMYSRASEQRTP